MAIAIKDVVEAVNYLNLVSQETAIDIFQVKLGSEYLNQAAQNLKSAVQESGRLITNSHSSIIHYQFLMSDTFFKKIKHRLLLLLILSTLIPVSLVGW